MIILKTIVNHILHDVTVSTQIMILFRISMISMTKIPAFPVTSFRGLNGGDFNISVPDHLVGEELLHALRGSQRAGFYTDFMGQNITKPKLYLEVS